MSGLVQTALKLLRVNSHVSVAGFHARTAVAERYCRTVERYLKPYLDKYKCKWGLLLPWIAFQLRQAPCSVTHFSPHELALGKNFPDQLDDLKDELMGLTDSAEREIKRDVLSYVTDLRQRLAVTREIADKNADIEHKRTKSWYDQHCTPGKVFKVGEKVLFSEQTDLRRMYAKWSEPAEVVNQIGPRTYSVKLADHTIESFHINQLRKFNQRTDFVCPVIVAADSSRNAEDTYLNAIEDEMPEPVKFNIDETQPVDEQESVYKLLCEFKGVFRSSLGCTNLAIHKIDLSHQIPCVSKSYRIPEMLKKPLDVEIERLLAVKTCSSQYRAPLIPSRNQTEVCV